MIFYFKFLFIYRNLKKKKKVSFPPKFGWDILKMEYSVKKVKYRIFFSFLLYIYTHTQKHSKNTHTHSNEDHKIQHEITEM